MEGAPFSPRTGTRCTESRRRDTCAPIPRGVRMARALWPALPPASRSQDGGTSLRHDVAGVAIVPYVRDHAAAERDQHEVQRTLVVAFDGEQSRTPVDAPNDKAQRGQPRVVVKVSTYGLPASTPLAVDEIELDVIGEERAQTLEVASIEESCASHSPTPSGTGRSSSTIRYRLSTDVNRGDGPYEPSGVGCGVQGVLRTDQGSLRRAAGCGDAARSRGIPVVRPCRRVKRCWSELVLNSSDQRAPVGRPEALC